MCSSDLPTSYTSLPDGSHTFSVRAKDQAGNTDATPASYTWTIDATAPITTASPAGGSYNSNQQVTLTANEPATIYYTKDGTNPTTSSSQFTGTTIKINSSTTLKFFAKDTAGNSESVKTEVYTIDKTAPTPTITSTQSSPTNASPINFQVTFGEDVTGFTASDITLGGTATTGGVASFTTVSANSYTFTVAPTADGTILVNIAANTLTDLAGNSNNAATQYSITSVRTAPTVTSVSSTTANG